MGRRRDPEATIKRERVIALWNAGKNRPEIAAALGIPPNSIGSYIQVARERGYRVRPGQARPNPATTKLRNAVIDAFNRGNTQAEIADKLDITRGAVGRLLTEARALGIPVVTYSPTETSRRSHVSRRQRLAAVSQTATDN